MGGLRAAAGSRDLIFIVKAEKTSPNSFIPVPFAGALLGWLLPFQKAFPGP